MKCILLDDEPLALRLLEDYIRKTKGLDLVLATLDPFEAIHFIKENKADVLFLDIQMPELSGLQMLKIIGKDIPVIISSAYEQYAIKGYEFDVVDYLLKPVSYDRFLEAINRLNKRGNSSEAIQSNNGVNFIFVKSEYKLIKLNFDDILHMESDRDYITIYTAHDKILTLQSLSELMEQLPSHRFCRIHRSHIIHLEKIVRIENNRVVIADRYLPVGETYKDEFYTLIGYKS
jgi:two-component system LytT family response regulator